jgi:tetratricopeptide (TPR) repeat protein
MHPFHGHPPCGTRRRVASRSRALIPVAVVLLLAGPGWGHAASAHRAVLPTTPARHAVAPPAPAHAPTNLRDLSAWLDYRMRNHLAALPLEARYFYREGLLLHDDRQHDEAVRFVRGAAELDPGFVSPHLTLASWLLPREPSQALLQYAAVIELARDDFLLQLALAGNALHLLLIGLFIGLLGAGLVVLALHNHELRHAWSERIGRLASPTTAPRWAWVVLLLPFASGLGLALPTLVLLGLLRPTLRAVERAVLYGLLLLVLALPWAVGVLDRLAVPIGEARAPYYGVPLVAAEMPMADKATELFHLAARVPDSPFLQFASAWTARRSGDLATAEAGYRRALDLWPRDDRVLSNLGNVLAMQGRPDEALDLYQRAGSVNPGNAAPPFNASQIYTQRFDYHAATDAVSRASALNFDLVKSYQAQATDDGVLPLVDQWISPRAFWAALPLRPPGPVGRDALPPAWRGSVECSGWGFTVVTLLLVVLALLLGARLHHTLPLRACSNCGAVLCRRCARRRRETALCPACAVVEARADTPDFARVLLHRRRREVLAHRRYLQTGLALLVPGYGLLAHRRVLAAVLLLGAAGILAAVTAGVATPFWYEARPLLPMRGLPVVVLTCTWLALYAASFLGYLAERRRADAEAAAAAAPVRSRIRLSNRDRSPRAA